MSIESSCNGGSPWKGRADVVRAALALDRKGINVAGLTDQEVLEAHRIDLNSAIEGVLEDPPSTEK